MADKKKNEEKGGDKKEEMIKETATFDLKLSHDTVTFSSTKLGEQMTAFFLKMTNPLKERVAYKVKCTSNEMFKIKQPVGYIDANQFVEVQMVHNPGKVIPESGKQYFAVYYLKVPSDKETENVAVRDFLKNKKEFDGVKRLYIDFNRNGKPWEEEARKEKEWEKEKVQLLKKKVEEEKDREEEKKEKPKKKDEEEKPKEEKKKEEKPKEEKKEEKKEKKKEEEKKNDEKEEKPKEKKKEEKPKEEKEDKKDEEKEKK